jgi:DNA-binding response OmpR family regulator
LQIVKNNADRLTTLVNELLDLSSIDSGRLNLMLEPLDPVYIVDSVLTDLAPRAAEQGLDVRSLIEDPLPSVRADPARLTQILTNLVENAIKYTPTKGKVRISAQVVRQELHFHITDNGIGISRVDQEKLFSRFFRADNTMVQAHDGTGLGLSIVKAMVELHGGEVWLKSRLGEGSTFSFSIPLAEQDLRAKPRPEFRTISYRVQDKHILVVEDRNDEANWIAHQLRSQGGYRVHVVRSGRDALDYLSNSGHPTDLITLDLRLPDMDGLQVLQQIRSTKSLSAIPVVITSIRRRDKDGQRLDAEAYLTKPIEAGSLLATIKDILSEKAKVLVVEDDQSLAHLYREVLERNGFEAILRYDGRQAVSTARAERPGLILLDIKLPGMDGFEVLGRLKNTPETRDMPVIVITGSITDAEGKRRRVLDMGAMQFMTKPLDVGELVAEIQEVFTNGNQESVVSTN